jgi:anti-sigma B factor antagonist
MSFTYTTEKIDDLIMIILRGRFIESGGNHGLIEEVKEILESQATDFIVDLSGLEYLNSVGINTLVKMVNAINRKGHRLAFVNVPDKIKELLEVIKLNSVFTILDSTSDAVKLMKQ